MKVGLNSCALGFKEGVKRSKRELFMVGEEEQWSEM